MKTEKRLKYLLNSPQLLGNILFRGRYDFDFDLMDAHTREMSRKKRLNLLKSGFNLIQRRTDPWSWPIFIQLELTNYCNLKCKVCPSGNGLLERKPLAIDPALFEQMLDEAGPYLLLLSLFAWGEPLLHPQLAEILRLTQNRGLTTIISTNGQNLDDPKVQKALIDYPPTYLIVGLDGMTDQTNSGYRVGARLKPALDGVRSLAKLKYLKNQAFPILNHRYIIMKHNEHELPALPGFSAENGFDMLTVRTLSAMDNPDQGPYKELLPNNPEYLAYRYANGKRISMKDFICEKPFVHPTILADGKILVCDQDYNGRYPLGTMAVDNSFSDVWWSKKAAKVRQIVKENPESFSMCKSCPFKDRPGTNCCIKRFDLKKSKAKIS